MADTSKGPSTGHTKSQQDKTAVHKLLENAGITKYHERVPLQLMDFAYRHTLATLNDAHSLISAGYDTSQAKRPQAMRRAAMTATPYDLTSVPYPILQLSIRLRSDTQFNSALPRAFQEELAEKVNATPLPAVTNNWGLGLPQDQHCLLGVGWRLREEKEREGEKEVQGDEKDGECMHGRFGMKRRRGSGEENSDEETCEHLSGKPRDETLVGREHMNFVMTETIR